MQTNKNIFKFLVAIVLVQSQFIVGDFKHDFGAVILLPYFYLLFYLSTKIVSRVDIWKDKEMVVNKVPTMLWGVDVFDDEDDLKEKRLMHNLELSVRGKRILATIFTFLATSILTYFLYKTPFSIGTTLLNLTALVLINSSYYGHFLFVVILNITGSIGIIAYNSSISPMFTAIHIATIVFCYVYFNEISNKKNKSSNQKEIFFKAFKVFLPLLLLYSFFSVILPDQLKLFSKEKLVDALVKNSPKKQKRTSIKLPGGLSGIPKVDLTPNMAMLESQMERMEKSLENIEDSISNIPNITPEMNIRVNELKLDISELKGSMGRLKSGGVSVERAAKFWKKLESTTDKMNKLDIKFNSYKEDVEKSAIYYNSPTSQKLISNINKTDITSDLSQLKQQAGEIKVENSKVILDKIEKTKEKIKERNEALETIAKEQKKQEKKKKDSLNLMEKIEKAAKAFGVFGLIMLISLIFRKKKVADEKLSKEDTAMISKKIKSIQKQKLDPNEEIIKSYNVFKAGVANVRYTSCEVPPPEVLFRELVEDSQRFEKDTWCITDLFCNCYYGSKVASKKELNTYRNSFKRVLKNI